MELYYVYFYYINGIIFSYVLGCKNFFFLKDILKYLVPFFSFLAVVIYFCADKNIFTPAAILIVGVLPYYYLLGLVFWVNTKKLFISLVIVAALFMINFIPQFISYEVVVFFLKPSFWSVLIVYYLIFTVLLVSIKFLENKYRAIETLSTINYSYRFFSYLFFTSFLTFVFYRIHYSTVAQQNRFIFTWMITLIFIHLFIIIYAITKREVEYQIVQRQAEEYRFQRMQIDKAEEFKHDYKGILLSLMSFLEDEKNEEALHYLQKIAAYSERELKENVYDEIAKITNFPIQGALLKKFQQIEAHNITLSVHVTDYITNIGINVFDCIRILNIVLDNAIEASEQCENPVIEIELKEVNRQVFLQVANSVPNDNPIDLQRITNKNYSTKAHHQGKGLHIIKRLCNKYNNLNFNIQVSDDKFIIILGIY